jgi:hypothetical protein
MHLFREEIKFHINNGRSFNRNLIAYIKSDPNIIHFFGESPSSNKSQNLISDQIDEALFCSFFNRINPTPTNEPNFAKIGTQGLDTLLPWVDGRIHTMHLG